MPQLRSSKAAILKIIGSDDFRQGRNAPSLQARMDYFRTLATYHFMAGEPEQALACNQALLNLLEKNPFLRELYPSRYAAALNNFLLDNYQVKNRAVVEQGLAKLRSLPALLFLKKNFPLFGTYPIFASL